MTERPSPFPLDDVRALVADLPSADAAAMAAVERRLAGGADCGRLADLARWMAGWQGHPLPRARRPVVAVFAGSHALAVGDAPGDAVQVASMQDQSAPVCGICRANDLGLKVFELALEMPAGDITAADALAEDACAATIAYGMEATADATDVLGVATLGAGGEIAAAVIATGLYGGSGTDWLVGSAGAVAGTAAKRHDAARRDPLELLRRVGGRETAAAAGAILAARLQQVPVFLEGVAALAAAACLHAIRSDAVDHCRIAEAAPDTLAARLAGRMGQAGLLQLDMAGAAGCAAATALTLARSAAAIATPPDEVPDHVTT